MPQSDIVSLCGGNCEFGFCSPCAAKTYQLLGRKNFLHSRGGPQTCRGLQCDGCRTPTPLPVVQGLKTVLAQHRLLSDEGAEANAAEGAETDLTLLNSAVALVGCQTAETLISQKVLPLAPPRATCETDTPLLLLAWTRRAHAPRDEYPARDHCYPH